MPFFQNPFPSDYKGNWVLGDRQHSPTFQVNGNFGRDNNTVYSFGVAPFNLSGNDADGSANDTLRIHYAFDNTNWSQLEVDVAALATSSSAVQYHQIVDSINADANFSPFFTADRIVGKNGTITGVKISVNHSNRAKFYVVNGGAETLLLFNQKAPVAEIPSYFARHALTLGRTLTTNSVDFPDSLNALVQLNHGVDTVDDNIITAAGFNPASPADDYTFLTGRSGLFIFQNIGLDANGDIAQIIEYHAGAGVGDMAKKICYFRDGAGSGANPVQITEVPYTLTADDLVTPDCSEVA